MAEDNTYDLIAATEAVQRAVAHTYMQRRHLRRPPQPRVLPSQDDPRAVGIENEVTPARIKAAKAAAIVAADKDVQAERFGPASPW